ncbi:MAG: ABC transporter ATP-binding protein [Acidobacteria bacterium]|nr:ABC transporter ATP-binding protein [Acidobacteriota bacterium]
MTAGQRLLGYLGRYRRDLALGAVCVIGAAAFSLAKPLIVGTAVDVLRSGVSRSAIIRFSLFYVGAALVQGVFLYLHRWIVIGASRKIEYDMRGEFYDHLQSLPAEFYQENKTGDLMSRATNDLSSVRMLVGPAVMHAFSSILVVVGAFVMMSQIDLQLALISLLAIPAVAGAVKFFGERIHERFRDVQDHFGEISARVQENVAGVRVVRAFTREEHEKQAFEEMNEEYVEKNRKLILLTATFYPLLHSMIGVMFVVIFFLGSRRILSGSMSVGEFVSFTLYLGRLAWPLIALGWVINLFQRGMASMKRLHEILVAEPATETTGDAYGGEQLAPEIEFRGLTFGYGETPVLHDIDLAIREGETLGIVGRTGSGKSTLCSLVTRVWEPPPGTVFVGGVPVESIPPRRLRSMIGVVPQETFLFSDTIAENIRVGRIDATDDELAAVVELAGLEDDVRAMPEGIATVIGERGITLSGGQKQRTAIARAIVRNPGIMILDDALSAVDTHTEERILRSLRELRRGRTVVIVAHRISSVKDADQIVVLDEGRIVERGAHDELLAAGGFYADLYRRQALEEELEEIA